MNNVATTARDYVIPVVCPICRKEHEIAVRYEDYILYTLPNRPLIQDIFPYLTASEREMLVSGVCDDCWHKMFDCCDEEVEDDE